jgi:hypothetical protein
MRSGTASGHTCAWLVVSLADIGDLLGRKDLATTQIYTKVQQEHLRTAVSQLNPLVLEVGRDPRPNRHPWRCCQTTNQLEHIVLSKRATPVALHQEEVHMARWQPRTPKESLQASLERLKSRIQGKSRKSRTWRFRPSRSNRR